MNLFFFYKIRSYFIITLMFIKKRLEILNLILFYLNFIFFFYFIFFFILNKWMGFQLSEQKISLSKSH